MTQPAFDRERFIKDLCLLAEMNIPFSHQGRDLITGMDCVNVLRYAYELQKPLPEGLAKEMEAYDERPDGQHMIKVMRKWFREISVHMAQPADVLNIYARKNPQHVAALVGVNEVVEAFRSEGGYVRRVLRQPLDPRRHIATAFRIPDFA